MCVCILRQSVNRVQLFVTSWTVAREALLSTGFPRQKYWHGLSFPPPQDLPDPEIKLASLESPALEGGFFAAEPPGMPIVYAEHRKTSVFPNRRVNWKKKGGGTALTNECLINNIKYKVCRLLFLFNFFTTHRNIGINTLHNIFKIWDKTVDSYIDPFNLFYF